MRYTFSITELCFDGAISTDRLQRELSGALRGYLNHVSTAGDELHVEVPGALPDSELENIRKCLKLHRDDRNYLPTLKAEKFAAIDRHTRALISEGFVAGGLHFSLSLGAQVKLLRLDAVREDLEYPIALNTLGDEASYSIDGPEALHEFALRGLMRVHDVVEGGTDLKNLVRAATTPQEVAHIIDPR